MKYTKDNIEGILFKTSALRSPIYRVNLSNAPAIEGVIDIKSAWTYQEMCQNLNNGGWTVVEFKIINNYPIY